MNSRNCATVMAVFFVSCGVADAKPPDFIVEYDLRETPGNPLSIITHRLIVALFEDSRDGDNIGWAVAVLTIYELDGNGDVIYTWSKAYPAVDTADSLWWIEHADPDNPVMEEFVLPPRIYDTAPALNSGVSDLDFDIEGNVYVEPPGGAPFGITGSLDSFLQLAETPAPEPTEKEDEPVEIPEIPESPYLSY